MNLNSFGVNELIVLGGGDLNYRCPRQLRREASQGVSATNAGAEAPVNVLLSSYTDRTENLQQERTCTEWRQTEGKKIPTP